MITRLYVRISGSKAWGPNRVGKAGLAAGAKTQLMLDDGVDKCVTDLTLTTRTGVTFSRQVVFCQSPNFTYHGD